MFPICIKTKEELVLILRQSVYILIYTYPLYVKFNCFIDQYVGFNFLALQEY